MVCSGAAIRMARKRVCQAAVPGVWLLLALLPGSGCSSTMFQTYPSQVNPILSSLRANQPLDPGAAFRNRSAGEHNALLWSLEEARTAQILADREQSIAGFRRCLQMLQQIDDQPLYTVSGALQQGAAVAVNDNMIPYRPEGYERIMIHHFQALNFLFEGDVEACAVEIRRANFEQSQALERHQKELAAVQDSSRRQDVETGTVTDRLAKVYAGMDEVAGRVKSSFQNAYTFYLSGILYEQRKQFEDAYIDYRKALEIIPTNRYVQEDALRLARILGRRDDSASLAARFPAAAEAAAKAASGSPSADLIILFEDDFIPQKQQVRIPIPIIGSQGMYGVTMIAFPYYEARWQAPQPLTVSGSVGVGRLESQPICYLNALAAKALQEKIPILALRQALRTVAKGVAAKMAHDRAGALSAFAVSLFNVVSENADTRSWNTLPGTAHVLRTRLESGRHSLRLAHPGSGASADVEIELGAGETLLLLVTRAGITMYIQSIVLQAAA